MGWLLFLALAVGYLAVCYAITMAVAARIQVPWRKAVAGLGTALTIFLLPWVDGIWGGRNLHNICATDAGTKISGKVRVPAAILEDKRPPLSDRFGNIDWSRLKPYVVHRAEETSIEVRATRIQRITDSLVRVSDGAEIARQTAFYYRGGLIKFNGDGVGAASCMSGPTLESVLASVIEVDA